MVSTYVVFVSDGLIWLIDILFIYFMDYWLDL